MTDTMEPIEENEQDSVVKERLEKIRKVYGFTPLVSEVLSERGDIFIPFTDLTASVFFRPKHLDQKTVELAAISSAAALASEHCLGVHIEQAKSLGVTEEEIFEAMMVGSMMSMNRSQSIAFRKFKDSRSREE
ncbi:MAG: carboxymuconolactone decarboxylase family protein [Methanomassiliicoccales archaeon]|nr:carboxymuconolactone decarboxylase family protein [Methanomassiliicoccales archaeon]NYT15767.1 carboxymuconolactone decarboxylase family protein [Methanomassiliicoccales archaeon]